MEEKKNLAHNTKMRHEMRELIFAKKVSELET